jgi:hypothetical protein
VQWPVRVGARAGTVGRFCARSILAIGACAASAVVLPGALLRAQAGPKRVLVVPPLVAVALRDLAFGSVLPGIPSSVPVSDPLHTGLFAISGPAAASVRVEFILPTSMAFGTSLLPIVFGAGDGFADFNNVSPPGGTIFDPHAPLLGALGPGGQLFVRMGGTVFPVRTQTSGAYAATITMTVFNLGS